MVILQLKQCERALADGRLDEAYDLVRRVDVRAHRRGQELTSELVTALIDRGRGHLAQGRLPAAAADAGRAVQLGGNMPQAVELRDAVGNAQRNGDRLHQQAGQAIALVRRHIEQGQLSVGQQLLTGSPLDDTRLEDLKQELTARRAGLDSSLKKATASFDAGDWEAAIDHLALAGKNALQDCAIRRLADRVADHVTAQAVPLVESGRLDAAAVLLEKLDRLPVKTTAVQRLHATLEQCRSISTSIEKGLAAETAESLLRLQLMWPSASWVQTLAEHARQWGQSISALRTSPLSLLALRCPSTPIAPTVATPRVTPQPVSNRQTLVVHVDGIGSYQVLTDAAISIGPRGSSRKLDLPLMLDSSAPTIKLSRSDEDYFLTAGTPVMVNESPCTNRLLRDGDRIGLGNRCRLTFRRPSAASGTALLDISGARLPTAGIRQVILMDREIVIGPSAAVHIRADELQTPAVLMRTEDGTGFRGAAEMEIDGHQLGKSSVLPFGVPISIGSLRFVISREQRP